MSALANLLKIAAVGGAGYLAADYFGLFGSGAASGAPGSSPGAAPTPAPPVTAMPAAGGTAAPPAAGPPYASAYSPSTVAPVATPAPPVPPVGVSTDDTTENRMRAVVDPNFAAIFPVMLNADEWNWYRMNATGREYQIDGMFDPSNRGEQMTAATFLQRSREVYGLQGIVKALSGRYV